MSNEITASKTSVTAPLSEGEIELLLMRLQKRLQARFASDAKGHPKRWDALRTRLEEHFPALVERLVTLYGTRVDFFYHLEELLAILTEAWLERPKELRKLDAARIENPHWFQSNQMLGGVLYVDLFAGNLEGVRKKIPYFQELGLTYLHLMPLFKVPEPENDGGYAVSSYREVNPTLGTMKQLRGLAKELHEAGIVLVVDFVFNHTANDHEWVKRTLAGDIEYKDFYFIFPDRTMPDKYDKTLREIFPDVRRGSFTKLALPSEAAGDGKMQEAWVWTTFHSFQWDLNYRNPAVFNAMAREMLFLANQGVDVLRLDAVAFIWKELGTNCENLPEAHLLIQAFNLLARIAAPGMLFKSEAIVHPDEVVKYISRNECQLSYNPLLMALLWNSLATRKTRLLNRSMARRFAIPQDTAWVNYVRVHDDIGWTFDDADAWALGINGMHHRRFLNDFYSGRFPGSFAKGLPFQFNPDTGDMRISGTAASLAGLEKALEEGDETEVEYAIRRILLIHGIVTLIGGIPLIYLGDEIATVNDYAYEADEAKAHDSRWVHRSKFSWADAPKRHDASTVQGRVYQGLQEIVQVRKLNDVFAGGTMRVLETGSDHLFAFERSDGGRAVVIGNFSEQPQVLGTVANEIAEGRPLYGKNYLTAKGGTIAPLGLVVLRVD